LKENGKSNDEDCGADATEQSKPVAGRIGDEISHLPPVSLHRTDLLLN